MICDNFNLIADLLEFRYPNDFYLITLFKRKKDQGKDAKYMYRIASHVDYNYSVKNFYIFSKDDLFKYKDEIIELSGVYNARAYIYLQHKNYEDVFKYAVRNFTDVLIKGKYDCDYDIMYYSAVDCVKGNQCKYLIDLDEEFLELEDTILELVKKYNKEVLVIPSLTGKHIICNELNQYEFMMKFPQIKLHENKPTLLYYKKD